MGGKQRSGRRRWTRAAVFASAAAAGVVSGRRARRRRVQDVSTNLNDSITIDRDRLGVPHIVAASWEDALFGFGFAVAEDRLWQMDVTRRSALGRLSEIVGPAGLESDRLMRLIGMPRIASRLAAHMTGAERAAAERFSAGVNHFIATAPPPLEFRALRYRPERWTPSDSLAVLRLLSWMLSGSVDADLLAERLRETVGDEWTEAIYRGGFAGREPIVRDPARCIAGTPEPADRMAIFPRWGASNAWAVSGDRSATGGPLLANDPHLELRNPSIWYEARIEAPGFRVAGMTVPGVPAVVIGRTPGFAWGATAAATPQVFVYREDLRDDASVQVDDRWEPLRVHDEVIGVRGEPDEVFTIRYTPRGPLISDLLPQAANWAVSFHWTGMEEGHELDVLLEAARTQTIEAGLTHFRKFVTPALNIVCADSTGEIAMVSMGRMAVRSSPPGLLPPDEFPPWYVEPEDLPLERNPERGWVACANNRLVDERYPHAIHGNWAPGFRYRRIVEDLESRHLHSPGDMRTLQLDVYSGHAASVLPALLDLLEGAVAPWVSEDLRAWDLDMTSDSRPALLFEAIYHEWTRLALERRLPADLAGWLIRSSGSSSVPVLFVDRLLRGELPAWMSDEERRDLAGRAAGQALAWIKERLGPDREQWTWGGVHRLTFKHPLGMLSGPHRRRVNVGPFPVPGSRYTVWPMIWDRNEAFEVVSGPSMRFVADLSRPEQSWISNTLGQSGSPLSRHFRDQVEDYLAGFVHQVWPRSFPPARRRVIQSRR